MSIYWKIAVWVFLIGQIIGFVYGLVDPNTTTFTTFWLALGIAIAVKLIDMSKALDTCTKLANIVQDIMDDAKKEEETSK